MDFWLLLDWELEDLFNVGGRGLEKLSIMNQNNIIINNLSKGFIHGIQQMVGRSNKFKHDSGFQHSA